MVEAANTLAGTHEGSTAVHEAWHAVAHVRLGILQWHATIEPLDADLAGSVLADDSVWNRDDAENQALALYAGYAACLAAGLSPELAAVGCDDDFAKAEVLISDWRIGDVAKLTRRAVDLMSQPENIKAVQVIAQELLVEGVLHFKWLDLLVDVADGHATEQEYQQFKHRFSRA